MIQKTINLYTFDELSKDVQEEVLQHFRNTDECEYLSDDMEYYFEELAKEYKISVINSKIYYSLSYCQGDGAMVAGEFEWNGYSIKVKHVGMYCHERSTNIEMYKDENDISMDADIEVYKDFEENVYIPMCKELARYGYDCIDTHNSDENLIEMIDANGYTFTLTGELENL